MNLYRKRKYNKGSLWSVSRCKLNRKIFLRTKSVTKKQIKAWQKCKIWTGFEAGTPGRKANTITTELKIILSNGVVRYCI